jgi:chemotaxis signal transduction protein
MASEHGISSDAEPGVVRLPERLDTLAVLRLAAGLRASIGHGPRPVLDGFAVDHIGLAGVQLLCALREATELRFPTVAVMAAIRAAGLGAVLLDDPDRPRPAGRTATLAFADAALDYGGEPIEALAALHAAGVDIRADVPADLGIEALAEADHLRLHFRVVVPQAVEPAAVEAILEPFEPHARIEWGGHAPPGVFEAAPAAAPVLPVAGPALPPGSVPIAQAKLDALASQVADLALSQSLLLERLGSQSRLSLEISEVDRSMRALQGSLMAIGTAPLGALLHDLRGAGNVELTGGDTEVDRGVFERIAPALADVLDTIGAGAIGSGEPVALEAVQDGGLLVLRFDIPADRQGMLAPLRDIARAVGGRFERTKDGGAAELRLPRSLMLLDAIIVDVGASHYAIPVDHMVEGLRPTADVLHRLDPEHLLLRFRGNYVPVVPLGEWFGLDLWERDPLNAVIVITHAGDGIIALMADTISDQRQVMVKPLGGVAPPAGIASAAIVGGSRIALTLDLLAFEARRDG